MSLVEHFVRFTSDSSGLERTFRMVQALLLIITSSPNLLELAASYMGNVGGLSEKEHVLATTVVLFGARDRVNMWRRFYRIFRFVESFHLASKLMTSLYAEPAVKSAKSKKFQLRPEWIDLFARMFSGMYLFLETLTVIDCMGVNGLAVWGPERARLINIEGQRYWFLSLGCSVLAAIVRMMRVAKDNPQPPPTEQEKHENMGSPLVDLDESKELDDDAKREKLEAERLRLRRVVEGRTKVRRVWIRKLQARLVVLGRRAVSDFIDMLAPGAIVGWTPASATTVGYSMVVTTLLTGYDVWLRCGHEMTEAKVVATSAEDAKKAIKMAQEARIEADEATKQATKATADA